MTQNQQQPQANPILPNSIQPKPSTASSISDPSRSQILLSSPSASSLIAIDCSNQESQPPFMGCKASQNTPFSSDPNSNQNSQACPFCNSQLGTMKIRQKGCVLRTWTLCLCFFITPLFAWIPMTIGDCYDYRMECMKCGKTVRYERSYCCCGLGQGQEGNRDKLKDSGER